METLNQREAQIAWFVSEGWSNREIAQHLSLAEQTVKNYLRGIFKKLKVQNRVQLALVSFEYEGSGSYIPEQPPKRRARTL
ncbi:MAG TPA: LuxR C-terminal-related transcriptional regulator [Terriglobales bacterium]